MRIPYVTRSSFLESCRDAIRKNLPRQVGQQVKVTFDKKGGYRDTVRLSVESDMPNDFGSDWEGTDPTRFPVRIRAAATALRDEHCVGDFEITHLDGVLTVARLGG